MNPTHSAYSVAAIILHWAIALGILTMIPLGWWMGDAVKDPAQASQAVAAFQLHKSLGLTILALSLARLAVRFLNPPPPLPAGMPQWERAAAIATHWAFYALMILMPLTGWIYVSTGYTYDGQKLEVATSYFGLFHWPDTPMPQSEGARQSIAAGSMNVHGKLAWAALVLAGLHVSAALKHHFFNRDDVLARMAPGLPVLDPGLELAPANPRRRAGLIAGFTALAAAALAFGFALLTLPQTQPAAAEALNPAQAAEAGPAFTKIDPSASAAPIWRVNPKQSAISFSGLHAGAEFTGGFRRWSADIRFDPENLAGSRALVLIETASAETGDATRDGTLRQAEWFDAANHPTAQFEAAAFRALGDGRFEAQGGLTIKGKTIPVVLPFTLSIKDDAAQMQGALLLDRAALNLGMTSDPNAQWVSRQIPLRVNVAATRAP